MSTDGGSEQNTLTKFDKAKSAFLSLRELWKSKLVRFFSSKHQKQLYSMVLRSGEWPRKQ